MSHPRTQTQKAVSPKAIVLTGNGDKTIKIDGEFITSLQSVLNVLRTDLTSVRQGSNPASATSGLLVSRSAVGARSGGMGSALNGLTVKAGGDTFESGKQVAARVTALATAVDGKLGNLSTKLSQQSQNLGYVLSSAKDTELANMSAVDAAAMLGNGTGPGIGAALPGTTGIGAGATGTGAGATGAGATGSGSTGSGSTGSGSTGSGSTGSGSTGPGSTGPGSTGPGPGSSPTVRSSGPTNVSGGAVAKTS